MRTLFKWQEHESRLLLASEDHWSLEFLVGESGSIQRSYLDTSESQSDGGNLRQESGDTHICSHHVHCRSASRLAGLSSSDLCAQRI